jgi:hypothetical protein
MVLPSRAAVNVAMARHCERSEAIQSRANRLDCFVASLLAMTARKKAGIAPGLLFSWMAGSSIAKTRFALMPGHDDVSVSQFEARLGGVAGHDLISVS